MLGVLMPAHRFGRGRCEVHLFALTVGLLIVAGYVDAMSKSTQ